MFLHPKLSCVVEHNYRQYGVYNRSSLSDREQFYAYDTEDIESLKSVEIKVN